MSNRIDDYVSHGFHRIEKPKLLVNPPKIEWQPSWFERTDESKIAYLTKLANTMNHAAALLQAERDEFARLCELKEGQLQKQKDAVERNNEMLQQEVTHMNEQRQQYHKNIQRLNGRIRALQIEVETLKSNGNQH